MSMDGAKGAMEPTWRFHRMGRDEPGIDPVQSEGSFGEEFFAAAAPDDREMLW